MPSREDVTRLLADLSAGKEGADEALLPLVYDELHALAKSYMRHERPAKAAERYLCCFVLEATES